MAKILIIDDDGIVRDALTVFLTRSGYEALSAADGANGLLILKNSAPDLVILDRDLPGLSGSEVLARIKETAPGVRVVILTGYDDPADAARYLKSGATLFLSKADGLSNVLSEVDGLLGLSRAKPGARAAGRSAGAAAPGAGEGGSGILIADDDEKIREVLTRFLAAEGYTVFSASDGGTVLDAVKTHAPEIVLLDICMPVRNGLEVLKDLREKNSGVDVLMITGNADEETARECLRGGAFDYIAKPVNLPALATLIRARLLLRKKA